jgi:hypothetical protein
MQGWIMDGARLLPTRTSAPSPNNAFSSSFTSTCRREMRMMDGAVPSLASPCPPTDSVFKTVGFRHWLQVKHGTWRLTVLPSFSPDNDRPELTKSVALITAHVHLLANQSTCAFHIYHVCHLQRATNLTPYCLIPFVSSSSSFRCSWNGY